MTDERSVSSHFPKDKLAGSDLLALLVDGFSLMLEGMKVHDWQRLVRRAESSDGLSVDFHIRLYFLLQVVVPSLGYTQLDRLCRLDFQKVIFWRLKGYLMPCERSSPAL